MSWRPMLWDSDDDWPLIWPDYTHRVPPCDKCCHPASHHGINLNRQRGKYNRCCIDCGCVASAEDFGEPEPVRGTPYAKG